ncbi:DNA-3-methyladenine glycosylase I [Agaribacter marinus]|uniref:DNA-3-methyladenine glycosylase I n=1 Tax=Agaribacter marinus TaxID=1431249 RepID=A0AA37T1C2_9ALTE|nr:DNA-3-methyladenine glycosylase I [Agaribacter marinus]GLR71970.1 DNA-3-methyladenine glycosylase I [Agaribacter marinus]
MEETNTIDDSKVRCKWSHGAPDYLHYHDTEWGFPEVDDIRLFEKICLESFQSGLSWRTILTKRESFREAFDGFDFTKIASYGSPRVESLLLDSSIIRHRGKIEAVINNAKRAVELVAEKGSLASYFWSFEPNEESNLLPQSRSTSEVSVLLSKDLKNRGWKFVGPTTVYAFMQAMGLINDHAEDCFVRETVEYKRKKLCRDTLTFLD